MNKKNKPEIRFSGFDGEWVNNNLGSNCNIRTGKKDANIAKEFGKYDFYTSGIEKYKTNSFEFEGQSITVAGNGATVGYMYLADGKFDAYQRTYVLSDFNTNRFFTFYSMQNELPKVINNEARAGNIPYIVLSMLEDLKLTLPSIKEQEKIGSLLKNIDDLIINTEKQYDHYKNIKDTLLNKMFPTGYSNIPEIRFKGFKEDWKDEKLENIGWSFTGLQGKTKNDFGHGKAKYITYLNIFNNSLTSNKNLERIEIDNKQNQVEYGDIFFTTSSETIEEAGMSSVWLHNLKNIYLNSFCFGFRLNNINDFNLIFLAYVLRSDQYRDKVKLITQGISRFNVAKSRLLQLDLNLPNLSEQTKIGELFKNLDDLIVLTKKKHEKLKNIKNALLNKMFC